MSKAPTISFIIPTYNACAYLERCLSSIRTQDYPQERVEILVLDGGSTDNTLDIAGRYNSRMFANPRRLAEYGVQLGMLNANGDLVVVFASDNEITPRDWIEKVTRLFVEQPELAACWGRIVAAEDDPVLNKYYVLIQSDPLSYFMNNNLSQYLTDRETQKNNGCYIFRVKRDKPLVWGANGLVYRRGIIQPIWNQEGYLGDNDAFQTMIEQGYNKVAYMPELHIYHHHVGSVGQWIGKWSRNYQQHFLDKLNTRNVNWVLVSNFKTNLVLWMIYSLIPLISLTHTLYFVVRDRNAYWLYHPIISFLQTTTYIYLTITNRAGRRLILDLFYNRR